MWGVPVGGPLSLLLHVCTVLYRVCSRQQSQLASFQIPIHPVWRKSLVFGPTK